MFNIAYCSSIPLKPAFDGGVFQQNMEIYFTLIRVVILTYIFTRIYYETK